MFEVPDTPCAAIPSVCPTATYLLQCTFVLGWKFQGCAAATMLCVFGNADWGEWQAREQAVGQSVLLMQRRTENPLSSSV